jgi:hypothetical protein
MKFERHSGFYGSALRNWIDNNLPRCPFCKTPSLWEYARKIGAETFFFKPSADRVHYRCPNCMAIISVAKDAITPSVSGDPIVILVKKKISKNIRVESVGNNENLKHLVGEEYSLEVLQEWARQIHEGKKM